MDHNELRQKYLDFFAARGHAVLPSARLVPENDPTTLFTGSGMQPLVPYLLGAEHPKGTRLVDSQKCFRSMDIEEVGDNRHTTFFEMLGNWSLGDYFKKEQLTWFFEFLTNEVGLNPERLYVTVFIGDESLGIPRDDESVALWQELFKTKGIDAKAVDIGSEEDGYRKGMQGGRIFAYDAKKNWWSRSGVPANMPAGEPGGPDSEVFYDFGTPHDTKWGPECHPNCDCGRFLEIGNDVFMQYVKQEDGSFAKLPKQNVDFGGGLERILAAKNGDPDVFTASTFAPIIQALEQATGARYAENAYPFRVIADHLKAAVFLIGDGVYPSNTDQGYFVRRLLRRAVRYADKLGMTEQGLSSVVETIVRMYESQYGELRVASSEITKAIDEEESKFRATLKQGVKKLESHIAKFQKYEDGEPAPGHEPISGQVLFELHTTYGFPPELSLEVYDDLKKQRFQAQLNESRKGALLDEYYQLMKQHQALSRAGAEQKFKGGLADSGEVTTMLHTCTHLMLAGLKKYLGPDVHQAGSNITSERTRFDFTYPEKVPREVLDKVEAYVNEAIGKKCPMTKTLMKKEDAKAAGVEGSFWEKYPDEVNVYAVKCEDLPAPRPDTYYVYALLCDDDSIYIGQTSDLQKRWREHVAGTASEHTKKHQPLKVVHYEEFGSRQEAVQREQDLKTGFGRKWLKRELEAGRTRQAGGTTYSAELCGGPHVENTSDIKGTFKIVKEEASSAGVRRVKAVLVNE